MRKLIWLFIILSLSGSVAAHDKAEFKNPSLCHRPMPLWFWNDTTVTKDEIKQQILDLRDKAGYGGVSILPFGGKFEPKYLSKEYLDIYAYTVEQIKNAGMTLSLYDEYGFPSGSGGAIGGDNTPRFKNLHPDMTMKRLDKTEDDVKGGTNYSKAIEDSGKLMAVVAMNMKTKERVDLSGMVKNGTVSWNVPKGEWKIMRFICVTDGDPNMDYLSKEAAEAYIQMTHELYYKQFPEAFGTVITHTFFDEPTIYRAKGRVWTPSFNEEFERRYGFSPALYYPSLWYDIGEDTQAARNALFTLRTDLYAEAYPQAIDRWSRQHGAKATGHQDNEEIVNPVGTSGDLMKCFQYLEIPGIDRIGYSMDSPRPAEKFYKIISSSAYNWDHSLVMSETYGAMGNISWDTIYQIALDQFAKGINVFIPHAAWYNDKAVVFLPELSSRNPLYKDGLYDFNTFLGRMHMMMQSKARFVAEIGVLYPIHTMQGDHYFDGPLEPYKGGVTIPYLDYVEIGEMLSDKIGRDYLWLHPEVLEKNCTTTKKGIVLANKIEYNTLHTLIIPSSKTISVSTMKKLLAHFQAGGKVIFTSQLPSQSSEMAQDKAVKDIMLKMLPQGESFNENKQGGKVFFISQLSESSLSEALKSDKYYDIEFQSGTPLKYIHKEANNKSFFYIANTSRDAYSGSIILRGKLNIELMDPHSGEITPAHVEHQKDRNQDITRLDIKLLGYKSIFLVEK